MCIYISSNHKHFTLNAGSSKQGKAARAARDSIWVEASTCCSPCLSAHSQACSLLKAGQVEIMQRYIAGVSQYMLMLARTDTPSKGNFNTQAHQECNCTGEFHLMVLLLSTGYSCGSSQLMAPHCATLWGCMASARTSTYQHR